MLEALGELTTLCHHLDLPVLGMVYARGPNLNIVGGDTTNGVAHAARVAFEIGCDVGKTTWTGDGESFARVTGAAPIPLLVAGGAKTNTRDMLTMVEMAIKTVLQVFAWADKSSLMNGRSCCKSPCPHRPS